MRRAVLSLQGAAVVVNLAFVILGIVQGHVLLPIANSAAALICLSLVIMEVRHGNRRAARDRDDSDTSPIASYAAALAAATIRTPPVVTPYSAAPPGPGLTETVAEVPILAFKRANLHWNPGGTFQLMSGHTENVIPVEADARCIPYGNSRRAAMMYGFHADIPRRPDHAAPDASCNCGFHARKTPDALEAGYGLIQLDLELSGRVIVHESGYRAEHQTVLRARAIGCFFCGEPVAAIVIDPSQQQTVARPVCGAHLAPTDVSVTPEVVAARLSIPFDTGDAS